MTVKTRKRQSVETLIQLGLSISYDRLMDIIHALGSRVFEQYSRERCVCPPNLSKGLFTTAAVDNIDHNLSTTTVMDSFHGTSISLFQHPSNDNSGTDRLELCPLHQSTTKQISGLPESYTRVSPLMYSESPMLYFWYMTIQIELILLIFVRSLWGSSFPLYVDTITELTTWFFGHVNYCQVSIRARLRYGKLWAYSLSRWWIHERKLHCSKNSTCLLIHCNHSGKRKNNTVVKGDEGAGGLTQNSEALRRWTVAGSEMARLIAEFDKSMDAANNKILHTMNKLTIYKNCLLSIYLH